MRGASLLAGAVLGGALVAACYSDAFRDKCKMALSGAGNEIEKQFSSFISDLFGNTTTKGQGDDGQGYNLPNE